MFGLTCYDYLGLLCGMQLTFCCGICDVSTLVWTRHDNLFNVYDIYIIEYMSIKGCKVILILNRLFFSLLNIAFVRLQGNTSNKKEAFHY